MIPEGIRPIPIEHIDDLIKKCYKRNDICAILEQNYGQKYSAIVKERIKFFKLHSELLVPLPPGMQQLHPADVTVTSGNQTSDIRSTISSDIRNPENTGNLGPSDATGTGGSGRDESHPRMQESHPADVTRNSSDVTQNPLEAVKSMSDFNVIKSPNLIME